MTGFMVQFTRPGELGVNGKADRILARRFARHQAPALSNRETPPVLQKEKNS